MGAIPAVKAIVEQNGTSIPFKSISIKWEAGRLTPSWSVDFPGIITVAAADEWTIKFGMAGSEWTKVDACTATSISGEDGVHTSTRSISSEGDSQSLLDLREYCLPKTLVFVNEEWLEDVNSTAFIDPTDKAVKYGDRGGRVAAGEGVVSDVVRYFHPRLPGKEFDIGTFECIAGPTSHHSIAKYLASLIGYRLVITTPDLDLQDTMTFASGTKWGEAVVSQFTMWGPEITVFPDADGPIIYVSDVLNATATLPGTQIIKIDNPAIVSTSLTDNLKSDLVDHVIVTGRKTKNSTAVYDEEPDFTVVEVPVVELAVDKTYTISESVTPKTAVPGRGAYDGYFGIPGQPDYRIPGKIVTQRQTIGYHRYRDQDRHEKYIPITETTEFLDASSVVMGKTVITHYYSKGFKPIRTKEEDYAYCALPGSETKALRLLRVKMTHNDQFIKPLNQASTVEIINDTILYSWIKHTDGKEYRVDPRSLLEAVRQDYSKTIVDTSASSVQDTLEMVSHERKTEILRTHDDVLIKRDYDYDRLSDAFKSTSQILENPLRDKPKTTKQDNQLRCEFFDGTGKTIGTYGPCYHPPKTVHHDDICTSEQAEMVADRIFARKSLGNNLSVTVKTPVPIPMLNMTTTIRLAAFTRIIDNVEVTIPEADYALRGIEERISYEGTGNQQELKYEQTLTLRTKY